MNHMRITGTKPSVILGQTKKCQNVTFVQLRVLFRKYNSERIMNNYFVVIYNPHSSTSETTKERTLFGANTFDEFEDTGLNRS